MSLPSIVNKNTPLDDASFIKPPAVDIGSASMSITTAAIPFWTEDPNVLFQKDHLLEFYPSENMSYNQKLNTITRVVLVLSVLLFIFTRNVWVLVVAGITVFFIYILYKNAQSSKKKNKGGGGVEGYENPAQVYLKENHILKPDDKIFQIPDTKNPFSNVLITDYEFNPSKKPAPASSNKIVGDDILNKAKILVQEQNPGQPDIAVKLFKDLNEELNFEQSMRPFYSTSNTTIPNDQAGFADFCYGSSISCKEGNLFACARNMSHYTLY
jgi:hypothetical protein